MGIAKIFKGVLFNFKDALTKITDKIKYIVMCTNLSIWLKPVFGNSCDGNKDTKPTEKKRTIAALA